MQGEGGVSTSKLLLTAWSAITRRPPIDSVNTIRRKNFVNGLQNALSILGSLEDSIQKNNAYEDRLLRCKAKHPHTHSAGDDEWWTREHSEDKESGSKIEIVKCSRSQVELSESWSTMSIVCLQYQYEELSKRYEALLQAYDDRCGALHCRDEALSALKQRTNVAEAHLTYANKALLAVGDKFMALRSKRVMQDVLSMNMDNFYYGANTQIAKKYELFHKKRAVYKKRIDCLKETLRGVLRVAEDARLELDVELGRKMADERDASRSMLLAEMRKCNRLCLENMRLKTKIEGMIRWNLSQEDHHE